MSRRTSWRYISVGPALAALSLPAFAGAENGLGSEWSLATAVSINTAGAGEGCPIETPDGLSLMFASNRAGGYGANDVWSVDRQSVGAPWGTARNIDGPVDPAATQFFVNSPAADFCPTPLAGRGLMFVSERTTPDANNVAPCGGGDMYLTRQSPAGGWSAPVNLGCAPNGPNFAGAERSPSLVETWYGTFLFYSSTATSGNHDIYVSKLGANGQFGPGRIVERLSTADADLMPTVRLRRDGAFEIVFSSNRATWGPSSAQPAFGAQDVYTALAWFLPQAWTLPRNLGSNVNTASDEQRSTISADGERLYFGRSSVGVPSDIYVSERQ